MKIERKYSRNRRSNRRSNRRYAVNASTIRRKQPIKAAKVIMDFDAYEPWSGAVDTYKNLEKFDKLDELEELIDEEYNGEIDDGTLNDLLWYEPEYIYESVGLYYDPEEDIVSDEPIENFEFYIFETDDENFEDDKTFDTLEDAMDYADESLPDATYVRIEEYLNGDISAIREDGEWNIEK